MKEKRTPCWSVRPMEGRKGDIPVDLNAMIGRFKERPDYNKMGMIATHLGVVRGTSLQGGGVTAIEVHFDDHAIRGIIRETEQLPGIYHVVVETVSGRLKVGEEIMAVMIGGDTREHVFPVLVSVVDRIKKECTAKKELFDSIGEQERSLSPSGEDVSLT